MRPVLPRPPWLLAGLLSLGTAFAQTPDVAVVEPFVEVETTETTETVAGLLPPSAVRYADPAWYDLVSVSHTADGIWLELAAVEVEGAGPLGLLQPILEVYVDLAPGGVEELLPGSTLSMPQGRGWELAYRVTGDGAWLWQVSAEDEPPTPLEAAASVDGRVLRLAWPSSPDGLPLDLSSVDLYAISGVHDPFREQGWRPFERQPSPWAFSSAEDWPPVVDVLPGGAEALEALRLTGRLPTPASLARRSLGSWVWWTLMGLGLALGAAGLVWRSRSGSSSDGRPRAEADAKAKARAETKAKVKARASGFDMRRVAPAKGLRPAQGAPPQGARPHPKPSPSSDEASERVVDGIVDAAPDTGSSGDAGDAAPETAAAREIPRPPRYFFEEDRPPLIDEDEDLLWEDQPAPAASGRTETDDSADDSSLSTEAPNDESRSARRS